MTSPATQLVAALRERRRLIGDEISRQNQAEHILKLKNISEQIVMLQENLPRPIDPQLVHFLARCSYDKALALLEEKESFK